MPAPVVAYSSVVPLAGATVLPRPTELRVDTRPVAAWLLLALGSLLLAGLLSLSVVLGRLPGLSLLIDDPLFFKRCLVVHVDLALVVWFYAFASALAALRVGGRTGLLGRVAFGVAALGVGGIVAGGFARGAEPVLANYIPVIDHPLFLGGLALFFVGVLVFAMRGIAAPAAPAAFSLPADAGAGVQACGIALALAACVWLSALATLPAGLTAYTFYEFLHWGPGHVLQVANVCAMLAVWLWIAARITGRPVLSARGGRFLFTALLAPHFVMPILTWRGALHPTYIEGATKLMRWGIFPVVLVTLFLVLRHLRRHRATPAAAEAVCLRAGLAASAGLTVLGFLLGACIRSSTTLVPAHYHASLGGVTAAFMTASFLLLRSLGRGEVAPRSGRAQLLCFGIGQAVFALGFGLGGVFGLGRKAFAGEQLVRGLGEQIGLVVMGLGGLAAAVGGVWFLVLVLRPFLVRRRGSSAPAPSVHA